MGTKNHKMFERMKKEKESYSQCWKVENARHETLFLQLIIKGKISGTNFLPSFASLIRQVIQSHFKE